MDAQTSASKSNSISDLIRKRKDWVRISQENRFDFESILAGLYSNPSHFIYELLQNAEDAGATRVEFTLRTDSLSVYHNGRAFNLLDVEAITGIGISTKRDDINAIGKFGVGFKSVFAVSQTPTIQSGEFHFQIRDFVVPSFIENREPTTNTQMVFPFDHRGRNPEEVFTLIHNKLDNIDLKTLLFLSNIHEISWKSTEENGEYFKTTALIPELPLARKVQLISQKGNVDSFAEYLVFQKVVEYNQKVFPIQIAFFLSADSTGNTIIAAEKDTRLCVYFPTERVTFLDFLIQAPFKTNPNREDIPLDDLENVKLIDEIAELYSESLPILKQLGYLTVGFLNILPLSNKQCNDPIYNALYQKTKSLLGSKEGYLPLYPIGYGSATEVLLAGVKDITDFLSAKDIEQLFGKQHWLSRDITFDLTRELRDYIIHTLGVSEVEYPDFVRRITPEFMATKSDEWVTELYGKLHERTALWRLGKTSATSGIARQKPIIRLEDNQHIEPFDDSGRPLVYFSSRTATKYRTVKYSIGETENGKQFLKSDLELREPDTLAEIREFLIPKYRANNVQFDLEEYCSDFGKFLAVYKSDHSERRQALIEELRGVCIVPASNNMDVSITFHKAEEIYLPTSELVSYFKNLNKIYAGRLNLTES